MDKSCELEGIRSQICNAQDRCIEFGSTTITNRLKFLFFKQKRFNRNVGHIQASSEELECSPFKEECEWDEQDETKRVAVHRKHKLVQPIRQSILGQNNVAP